MSVLMTLRVKADAARWEALASKEADTLMTVSARAKEYGVISHRFYGNEEEVVVVDEWPDPEAFRRFFAASPEIAALMHEAGVASEPEITFLRKLDTPDEIS